ncbi:hypothetical protein B0H11DRAFT_1908077 [Mycena galericulata]|nr:hypothetical protein B0H11DRAFT_1908077 [Mycena galericulata]
MLLARVCRAWRAISLGTGELWSRMHFERDSFARMREPMKLLDFHLTHAGKCLLDLHIELPELTQLRDAAWAALRPYSGQLRSLGLERSSFLDGIPESLPSLRKLDIRIRLWHENPVPIVAFADAPQLREAHILDLGKDLISLPWRQLTALTLEEHNFDNCLYILEETPHLQQLHLDPAMWAREYAKPVGSFPTCTLPHLHTLSLSRVVMCRVGLQAQAQVWVGLSSPTQARPAPGSGLGLSPSPTRPGPDPQHFEVCMVSPEGIDAIDVLHADLRACLAVLPTVHALTLLHLNLSADELKQLFSHLSGTVTDSPWLLPALTSLTLDGGFFPVDVNELAAMLVARWDTRHGARITSFLVSFHFDHSWLVSAALTKLRDLCRSGLTVSISQAPRNPLSRFILRCRSREPLTATRCAFASLRRRPTGSSNDFTAPTHANKIQRMNASVIHLFQKQHMPSELKLVT